MLSLLATLASAEPCPTTTGAVMSEVSAAEAAFVQMDVAAFYAARDRVRRGRLCVDDAWAPRQAAALHRLEALDAFLARDGTRVEAAFRAAVDIDPDYELPATVAVPDGPLAEHYATATRQDPPSRTPAVLVDGILQVDGMVAVDRPSDAPSLLQRIDTDGTIVWTHWVEAGQPPPAEVLAALPDPVKRRGHRVPLAVSAAGVGVGAAGLFVSAQAARGRYMDPTTSGAQLQELEQRANTLGYASQVTAVLALGLGIGAFAF